MIRYQGEDKELGGAEVQEEETKEQGQATIEEEPHDDKARKFPASGRGTTALVAVLPRHGTTGPTTATTTASNRENTVVTTVVGAVLPRRGTTTPITVLPCCLRAETGLRPLYPSLDPLRL